MVPTDSGFFRDPHFSYDQQPQRAAFKMTIPALVKAGRSPFLDEYIITYRSKKVNNGFYASQRTENHFLRTILKRILYAFSLHLTPTLVFRSSDAHRMPYLLFSLTLSNCFNIFLSLYITF